MHTPASAKKQQQIDLLTDIFGLIRSLLDESERACVIIAAARLDIDLEHLIKHVLHHHPGDNDPLFEGDRMLGTFSAKISLAYRLGIIAPDLEHSLQMVRKIRNDFAHQLDSENLHSQKQKQRLSHMVRYIEKSDLYQKGYKGFTDKSKSVEQLQFALCVVAMTISLNSGLRVLSRVNVGKPRDISYSSEES